MPNPTTIAVTHSTPEVTDNFQPVDRTGNLTTFRCDTSESFVSAPRLFVSVKRPGASENNYKIKIRQEFPTLRTNSDGNSYVAFTNRWTTEFSVHKDSTKTEVALAVNMSLATLSTSDIRQVVDNLEGFF